MATDGFFQLGEALLGGGIDREGAFLEGLETGSTINYRNAQTTNALAQARQRQQQAEAREKAGDAAEAFGLPREAGILMAGEMGSDFSSIMSGQETAQSIDFRELLADPNADVAARQGAGLALREEPIVAGDVFGPGGELTLDIFGGAQPDSVAVTPTGGAQIGADAALAGQRGAAAQESLADAALADAKRENPELFFGRRGGGADAGATPLAEQILPGLEGTSIVPGDINAEEGFGAESVLKKIVNSVSDTAGFGTVFPESAMAENVLSELSARTQIAMRADVPGGRPPLMVQQLLARYAEDPAQLFRGDELARNNLRTTTESLKRSRQRVIDQLNSPTEKTPTRQGELEQALLNLSDTIADYETILQSLEEKLGPIQGRAPLEPGTAADPTDALPAPPGASSGPPPGWTIERAD